MCLYYNMTYWFLHATRSQNASQSSSSQHSGCDPDLFDIHFDCIRDSSFCSADTSVHAIKNKIIILPPPCVLFSEALWALSRQTLVNTVDTRDSVGKTRRARFFSVLHTIHRPHRVDTRVPKLLSHFESV